MNTARADLIARLFSASPRVAVIAGRGWGARIDAATLSADGTRIIFTSADGLAHRACPIGAYVDVTFLPA